MKGLFAALLLIPLLSCKPGQQKQGFTSEINPVDIFKKETFKDDSGNTLHYNLLDPLKMNDDDVYPIIVFLHGAGERGDDNESQLAHIAPIFTRDSIRKAHPSFVLFPQCPKEERWGAIDEVEGRWVANAGLETTQPMKGVLGLLDQLIESLPIDTNRIYVSGLSMGGYGTYDILYRRPEMFAAAVTICGSGDESVVAKYAHVPIKIFHGTKDQVVPVDYSRRMYKALKSANARNLEYIEYPEGKHNVWDKAYSEPTLLDWIYSQKK